MRCLFRVLRIKLWAGWGIAAADSEQVIRRAGFHVKSLQAVPGAVSTTAAHLSSLREKLQFLRGKLRLFLFWPVIGIFILVLGWDLLFTNLEYERRETVAIALREAGALARSHADYLKRTF